MPRCSLYVLVILFAICQTTSAQQKKQTASDREYVIPFQLTDYNNLSVQAILNKKDTVYLMFHTAASSVTLIEESVKKLTSLHFDGTDSGVKSWGGSANTSRFSNHNSLQIGALTWDSLSISENMNSGQKTDGKFGTDLFQGKVIAIDFDKKTITLSNSLPAKAKQYEKLKLTVQRELMFLEATCRIGDSTFSNKFLVHSGYAGSVLFDDQFVASHTLNEKLKVIDEKALKDSYGNVLKTKKAILPAFTIGKEKLSNVPASFFEGAIGRQKMSIIGGDILKRFNIIIDAQRAYIYLKANNLEKTAYTNV